ARTNNLTSPQTYLYMIATSLVRDHWRKMERERRAFTKAAAGTDPEPYSDPSQDVDIRELLAALPARLPAPFHRPHADPAGCPAPGQGRRDRQRQTPRLGKESRCQLTTSMTRSIAG